MKIERIRIRNYRSIRDCTLFPGDLCALIGGNNTGKSNILRAINLVLGDRWPSVNSVEDRDYFQYRTDEDIVISIWYDETLQVPSEVGPPKDVAGIEFRVSRYKRKSGKHARGDRKADFFCIDDSGEVVEILRRPNPSSKPYPQPARVTAEIRDAVPAVFIDVDRSSTYHLSGAPRSILGRLLNRVSAELKGNTQRYEEFQEKFEAAREVLRTDAFVELETKVVFRLLCELEKAGTQVVYTTDNQDLVDLQHLDSVHLVSSTKTDGTVAARPKAAALPSKWRDRLRVAKHFGSPRDEVFFADSVVLVEGSTEQAAIRLLAEMSSLPLDKLNCSIIEAGGKASLPLMIQVVAALGKRSSSSMTQTRT